MNLQFEIEAENDVLIIHLKGKIISETDTVDLEQEFGKLLNQNLNKVIIDIEKLTHINSTGIGMMIKMITKSRILGGDLVVIGLNGNVAKIFDIAKLDEVFTLYSDKTEALEHFKQTA
jgi:anti-anti-sigma factor